MKLVWCPETAGKVYIDAVKLLASSSSSSASDEPPPADAPSDIAELIAAMAGGWNAQCILEAWAPADGCDSGVATSLALSAAARQTGGRHICVVPDELSRSDYSEAMTAAGTAGVEVVVGEAEGAVGGVEGVDFAVVDCRRVDAAGLLKAVRPGPRGAVIVCMEAGEESATGGGRWMGLLKEGTRVVRSALLPIGRGVEILHVGVGKGPSLGDRRRSRWIKHVDRETGEEHVFRR